MGVVHRFTGKDGAFAWEGVSAQAYGGADAAGVCKRVLVGQGDGAQGFEMRYFEVSPGGRTSLDRHAHDHGVLILRGRARVLLGDRTVEAGYGDVFYIPGHETHQLESIGEGPLGFVCVKSVS